MPLPRPSSILQRGAAAVIAAALAVALAPPAAGQERLELADDDTWQIEHEPEEGTPEHSLFAARRTLANGQSERAEFLATQFIERHPTSPLLPEAYLLRGDALVARREYYQSLFDYEFVARTYVTDPAFVVALERELMIAKLFASGMKRKLFGIRWISANDEAEELLIRIQERAPGSRIAEEAGITLADYYYDHRKMQLAAEMYALLIERHPKSPHLDKARKRLIYAHLASFKGPEFDAAGMEEARARLLALKAQDPLAAQQIGADALLTRIDDSDARKMLVTAQWYLDVGDPIAAEMMIRRMLRRYPRTAPAADALRLVERILPDLPPSVIAEAPDYDAMRAGILGTDDAPTDETENDP